MINIILEQNLVEAAVLGEFTLADFHEFEENLLHGIKFQGPVNLLVDLRDMLDFTVDVAWEEIRFSRDHAKEFGKIAIVTGSRWQVWSAWFNRLFTHTPIEIFDSMDAAEAWLHDTDN